MKPENDGWVIVLRAINITGPFRKQHDSACLILTARQDPGVPSLTNHVAVSALPTLMMPKRCSNRCYAGLLYIDSALNSSQQEGFPICR